MSATVSRSRRDTNLENLAWANECKRLRFALKREIRFLSRREGLERVAGLILQPPEGLEGATVRTVLGWVRRWSLKDREWLLAELEVGQRHDVSVGELTGRQRSVLAEALRARA